jgi:carbamoyltransferase
MKILGVHYSHDAGTCIIEDGKILAAVNEERYSREKLYWGFPEHSIKKIFDLAGVRPEEIDFVAFANITPGAGPTRGFGHPNLRKKIMDKVSTTFPSILGSHFFVNNYRRVYSKLRTGKSILKTVREQGVKAPVVFVEHHKCHAASALYTSPFTNHKDTLVVTTDGTGDGYCATVNTVNEKGLLKRVAATPFFHSPAAIYAYATFNMGFTPNKHEGKLTGLAAYGDANKTYPLFKHIMQVQGLEYRTKRIVWGRPGAKQLNTVMQAQKREDIAAGLQKRSEDVAAMLVGNALKKYPRKHVALAGGLFANVRVNQKIAELPGVKKIFVHPHMGDGGLAVGAALAVWAGKTVRQGRYPAPVAIDNTYFGPEYSNEEIEKELKKNRVKYKYHRNIEKEIAKAMHNNKIVGRFHGRMEYGPRALGNRSILASPTDPSINDWLNKRLHRTEFMPFAPSIMEEYAEKFYNNFKPGKVAAQFMTVTFDVVKSGARKAKAVAHIDNTARPQTVNEKQNKSYYTILKEYKKLSGLPLCVNTSFNMHEEPIVCSPSDAIRAFKAGAVDYLAIGDFMCKK